MSLQKISEYFKAEYIKTGEEYFRKDLVYLSLAADTQAQALVKAGTGARVHLSSTSISSTELSARCTCPTFAKEILCKHIWATLLAVQKKHPDFLDSKKSISAAEIIDSPETLKRKAQQADFKKAQAARLKERNQKLRFEKKKQKRASQQVEPAYSPAVQAALDYFDQNGFPLKDDLSLESIQNAKKKLARIFHPDLGGSHEEIVILNRHSDTLIKIAD